MKDSRLNLGEVEASQRKNTKKLSDVKGCDTDRDTIFTGPIRPERPWTHTELRTGLVVIEPDKWTARMHKIAQDRIDNPPSKVVGRTAPKWGYSW